MSTAAAALADNPFFSGLSPEDAEALMARAKRRTFTAGSVLIHEGREGESMIVLEAGRVDVQRGETLLATFEAGAVIGEMALLDPAPRSASVIAKTDGSFYELERSALWALLAEGNGAAVKTLQSLTSVVCSRLGSVNRLVQAEVFAPKGNVFSRLWKKVGKLGRK